MLPLLALMTVVGMHTLIPGEVKENNMSISRRRLLIGFWPFFIPAFFVYLLVQSQSSIANILGININADYTGYILMIEGDLVSHFQYFTSPMLTYLNGFIYLMLFSFLMIFTFVILIYTHNLKALEEFTTAFIIIYLAAFPFYIFVPVTVTGYTLPNVLPLLYELSPIIDQGVRVVDPFLDNDFPSLHAALSIMTLIVVAFRTDLNRYKLFTLVSTVAILFSTVYLGIHWITDLVAGAVLGLLSYYIAVNYRDVIFEKLHKILVMLEVQFGIKDLIYCASCSKEMFVIPHIGWVECPFCGEKMYYHPLASL